MKSRRNDTTIVSKMCFHIHSALPEGFGGVISDGDRAAVIAKRHWHGRLRGVTFTQGGARGTRRCRWTHLPHEYRTDIYTNREPNDL